MELIVVTDIYPYKGEAFFDNEIQFLADKFNKIHILTTRRNAREVQYDLPENVILYDFKKFKLAGLFADLNYQKTAFSELFRNIFSFTGVYSWFFGKYVWLRNYFLSTSIKNNIEEMIENTNEECILYSYWFHWSALAFARMKDCKYKKYSRAHGYDVYLNRNPQLFKRYILDNIDVVLPISLAGEKEIIAQTNAENVKMFRLGTYNNYKIDISKFKVNKTITFVSCSRITTVKQLDLMIDIFAKIENLQIKWYHIGDGELENQMKNYAEKKLNRNNVEYEFLGYMKHAEVDDFYKKNYNNIDFLISTSSSEGIPVSMMEAQSFGIPIICTAVGGNSELVNENCGYLIDYGNRDKIVKDFVERIEEYSKYTKKEMILMRKESINNWDKNYNAEKNYQSLYKEFLAKK